MSEPLTMSPEREAIHRRITAYAPIVETFAELDATREQLRHSKEVSTKLLAALKTSRCTCKQEWEEECPSCGSKLFTVRNSGGPLNDEQFDSVRAGDFYCRTCKGTESNTGYKYFWKRDLREIQEQCARCAAIALAERS